MSNEASLIEPNNRDAGAIIGGFIYQADLSIARWLDLKPGQTLELERGEDLAIASQILTATGEKKQWLLEQIKKRTRPLTLHMPEALTALAHFFEHRRSNPSAVLLFRYSTNVPISREKRLPQALKPSAIKTWERIRKGEVEESAQSGILEGFRKLLSSNTITKPEKIDIATWQEFKTFLKEASIEQLRAFIQTFEWCTETEDTISLRSRLKQRLIDEGYALNTLVAEEKYRLLFFHIFQVLSQNPDVRKQLTIEDLVHNHATFSGMTR